MDDDLDALRYEKPAPAPPEPPKDPIDPIEQLDRILLAVKIIGTRNSAWQNAEVRIGSNVPPSNLFRIYLFGPSSSNTPLLEAVGMDLPKAIEGLSKQVCDCLDAQLQDARTDRDRARDELAKRESMVRTFEKAPRP